MIKRQNGTITPKYYILHGSLIALGIAILIMKIVVAFSANKKDWFCTKKMKNSQRKIKSFKLLSKHVKSFVLSAYTKAQSYSYTHFGARFFFYISRMVENSNGTYVFDL